MYELIMFKGDSIIINENQYEAVIAESLTDKIGILIDNNFVNFKNIANIRKIEERGDYYDSVPITEFNPALLDTVKASPDSKWRTCVMMNCELLKKGLLPKYIVKNNKIITKEYYWRESEQLQTS